MAIVDAPRSRQGGAEATAADGAAPGRWCQARWTLVLLVVLGTACSTGAHPRHVDSGGVRSALRADFAVTAEGAELVDRKVAPGYPYEVAVVRLTGVSTVYSSSAALVSSEVTIGVPTVDGHEMMGDPQDLLGATLLLEGSGSPSRKEAGLPDLALQLVVRESSGSVQVPGFAAVAQQLGDFLDFLRADGFEGPATELVVAWVREINSAEPGVASPIDDAFRRFEKSRRPAPPTTSTEGLVDVPLQVVLEDETVPRRTYVIQAPDRPVWKRDVREARVAGVVQRGAEHRWTVLQLLDDGSERVVGELDPNAGELRSGISITIAASGGGVIVAPFEPADYVDPSPPTTVIYGG